MRFLLVALVLLATACDRNDFVELEGLSGKGSFLFGSGEIPAPVEVFYYVPRTASAASPVLIALHGNGRDAAATRDEWITKSEEYGVIVFAPLFDDGGYPSSSGYILGNVFEDGERPTADGLNPESEWAFSVIEPLFDDIKRLTNSSAECYDVFGHSAGAQFTHRLALFVPDGRYDRLVAANSGWYTVPDLAITYPYGLEITPVTGTGFFDLPLIVFLGDQDTDPNSAGLRHTDEADAQGLNRFTRGQYFFRESARIATEQGATFSWQLETTAGVGHNSSQMAQRAADLLY